MGLNYNFEQSIELHVYDDKILISTTLNQVDSSQLFKKPRLQGQHETSRKDKL